MCILFMYVNPHPVEGEYRLIVAANRDEYYKRPAKDAYQCENSIIGGRDMEPGREGGMWLGFSTKNGENGKNKKHCFAALLNVTEAKHEHHSDGRGVIVSDYLKSPLEFPEYVRTLGQKNFGGYNLVVAELSKEAETYYHCNSPTTDSVFTGEHTLAFGNSPVYCPLSKVINGRERFLEIIKRGLEKEALEEKLLELLKDGTRYLPDKELEKRKPSVFPYLSSIFVDFGEAGYGTRAHTVILIDYKWNLEFIEHALVQPIDIANPQWNVNVVKARL